jgi:hypothetical protein
MSDQFEVLLRQALMPVDPPEDFEVRLEQTLGSIVEAAAEELEAWELSTMHDPRNWVRPAAAAVVGGAAAVGLVVVRTQRKRHKRRAQSDNVLELMERTVRDLGHEARRLMDDHRR